MNNDELTNEMVNLEGIMKDLNVITNRQQQQQQQQYNI